ncbi:MAG: hypothetical protein GXP01_06400, partial [Alphaproteobacteria bacterium]|nr:hypothetical protein [Alphaproteobacteria bacterium]
MSRRHISRPAIAAVVLAFSMAGPAVAQSQADLLEAAGLRPGIPLAVVQLQDARATLAVASGNKVRAARRAVRDAEKKLARTCLLSTGRYRDIDVCLNAVNEALSGTGQPAILLAPEVEHPPVVEPEPEPEPE